MIVEMSDVYRGVPPWPRPVPRVRPVPAAVSFRRPLAQLGASSRCPWKHVLSRNCGSVQLGDVQRHFFDTAGDAADGCEAPCGAVDNGVCNTCSAAAASACSLMTCDANFFDTNGDATDGCKAPGGAVDNGACNTGSAAAVGARSSVTCNANLFRHQGRCR